MSRKQPRRHHFVPASYLAGFTRTGDRTETLLVIDREQRRAWRSRPATAAYGVDFYRVPGEGEAAFEVEREIARVENATAPSLRLLRSATELRADDLEVALYFIALQAVRGLGLRRLITDALERDIRSILKDITSSDAKFDEARDFFDMLGEDPIRGTREEVHQAVQEGNISMSLNMLEVIKDTLSHQSYVAGLLKRRHWQLVEPESPDEIFITSDNPLPLAAQYKPDANRFLQLLLPWHTLTFPLSSRRALIGTEHAPKSDFALVNREVVASVNGMSGVASRFLFCRDSEFHFTSGAELEIGSELVRRWKGDSVE